MVCCCGTLLWFVAVVRCCGVLLRFSLRERVHSEQRMWLSELADDGGFTPLINAAWRGDSHPCKTLYLSIRTGDFPTVRLLLQAGARTARKGAAAP